MLRTCLVLAISFLSSGIAFAEDAAEVAFTDWRVTCQAVDAGKACQMLQTGAARGEGQDAFLLSISRNDDTNYGVMTLPVGVYLRHGIELRVDQRRPFKVHYEVCDQTLCHAGFKLDGAVLRAFRQGLTATARVWVGSTQAVEFPISLRGFSAAFNYYQTETSP